MSKIYEKSKSEKYKKYFCSEEELERSLSYYSIGHSLEATRQPRKYYPWETGTVGVPLFYNSITNTIVVDHTDAHTLVVGPTGSKKSRLVAMPLVRLLATAGESMIISDPKAEIFNRTSSFLRKKNYTIIVLNLRSPMHGQRWNPLAIPYSFYSIGEIDKAYECVNDIAQNLILSKNLENDPFWENSSSSFFYGLVLLLFRYCKEHNLDSSYVHIGNVIKLRNSLFYNTGREINRTLWNYAKQDTIALSALIGTVETADDTRAGILSTFDEKTRMFSIQPNLLDMLSANDIDFDNIGNAPTAVFLIVPDEKTSYHGLVSLFIKQSYEYLIYQAQTNGNSDGFQVGILRNRLNYVLDEFSSLPKIDDFPAMITAARSRNIRFTLFIQSKHQLIQRYKDEAETIQTNCNNWIFLTSRELQLLEELSKLCGNTIEDNPRPVLSVTDLQRLDKDAGEALLLCGRAKPCITHLADISKYDADRYESIPTQKRESAQPPELIIQFPEILKNIKIEHSPLMDAPERFKSVEYDDSPNIDLEAMIKRIDKKIAELEKEEQEESKGLSERVKMWFMAHKNNH